MKAIILRRPRQAGPRRLEDALGHPAGGQRRAPSRQRGYVTAGSASRMPSSVTTCSQLSPKSYTYWNSCPTFLRCRLSWRRQPACVSSSPSGSGNPSSTSR